MKDVCRWIGHIGSKLVDMKNPDVCKWVEGPCAASKLELTDIPAECSQRLRTGGWLPKLLNSEVTTLLKEQALPRDASAKKQDVPAGAHESHDLRFAGDLTFCNNCARYTTVRLADGRPKPVRMLLVKCPGRMEKPTGQLGRMRKGNHPTTGKWMGPVRRP